MGHGAGRFVEAVGQSFCFGLQGLLIITFHSNTDANLFSSGRAAIPRLKDRSYISAI
jgi:hypothetical protein